MGPRRARRQGRRLPTGPPRRRPRRQAAEAPRTRRPWTPQATRFAAPDLADAVYLEQLTTARYVRKREDTSHYLHVMDRLSAQAEPPAHTARLLQQIIKTI